MTALKRAAAISTLWFVVSSAVAQFGGGGAPGGGAGGGTSTSGSGVQTPSTGAGAGSFPSGVPRLPLPTGGVFTPQVPPAGPPLILPPDPKAPPGMPTIASAPAAASAPRLPVPLLRAKVFKPVPGKRRMMENRGQGGIESSAAIQSIAQRESRMVGGALGVGLDAEGRLKPAWGPAFQAVTCNAALQSLRTSGRIAGFREPTSDAHIQQELAFISNCLGMPDERISHRLGRLVLNGETLCTVFFLTPTRGITARHCLFARGSQMRTVTLEPITSDMKSLVVEFGSLTNPKPIGVASIDIPTTDEALSRQVLSAATGSGLEPMFAVPRDLQQRDFLFIELQRPMTSAKLSAVSWTEARFGDKVFLPAYHEPVWLESRADDRGFRQQIAGYCQVIQPRVERCLTHACSTTPGASGAPMLVERDVEGSRVLHIVGIHTSGSRDDTACPGEPTTDTLLNYGVRLTAQDLKLTQ